MFRTTIIITVAILGISVAAFPLRSGDVRVGDLKTAGSVYSYHASMAAEGDSVYAVWVSETGQGQNGVNFSSSTDGGRSWNQTLTIISDTPPLKGNVFLHPVIAADGSNLLAAWEVHHGGSTSIHASLSLDGGQTWMKDHTGQVSYFGSAKSQSRSLCAAVGGQQFYVVSTLNLKGSQQRSRIYLHRSTDAGTTWISHQMDSSDINQEYDALRPDIAVRDDTVFIAWEDTFDQGNHKEHIRYNVSTDGGLTWLWQDDGQLDSGPPANTYHAMDPSIAVDDTCLYAAWFDNRNGDDSILMNRSTDWGQTWMNVDRFVSTGSNCSTGSNRFVEIVTSGTHVYAVWRYAGSSFADLANKEICFNLSTDNGATWGSSAVRLDADEAPGCAGLEIPVLTALDDDVYVAWNSMALGNSDIWLQHSADRGQTWLPAPVRRDMGDCDGHSHSLRPMIVSLSDRALLAWMDAREGHPDLYARSVPDDDPQIEISPSQINQGDMASFTLTGTPSQAYEVYYSYEGSSFTNTPPVILDLLNPIQMIPPPGPGTFDPTGIATGTFTIPAPGTGQAPYLFRCQAVDVASGRVSNVFRITVE